MPGFLQPTEGGRQPKAPKLQASKNMLKNEKTNLKATTKDVLIDTIEKSILGKLGIPPNFLRMETKLVGKNYRSNVLCVNNENFLVPLVSRPHSFYVTPNGDDFVFNPPITKLY